MAVAEHSGGLRAPHGAIAPPAPGNLFPQERGCGMSKKILKWGSPIPNDPLAQFIKGISKNISERTDGQIEVEVHAGDVADEFGLLQAVMDGTLDLGWTMSAPSGKSIGLYHCEAGQIPGWPSGKAGSEFTRRVVDAYIRPEMEARGMTPLVLQFNSCANFGYYTTLYYAQIWSLKEYDSLADLRGERVFAQSGSTCDAMEALGMTPVPMGYRDVGNALRDGTIDCAVLSSPTAMGVGLTDQIRCRVKVDYPQSEDNFTVINLSTYNSLTPEEQQIITEEWQRWETVIDRIPMSMQALEYWDAREKAGTLKTVNLTGAERDLCQKAFLDDARDAWVQRHLKMGFEEAPEYMEDLNRIEREVLDSGLPQYLGPRL